MQLQTPATMRVAAAHASSGAAALPFDSLPATVAPDRSLLTYYALGSLLLGPLFIFPLVYGWFRYHTLRYDIDEQGITMRWGILFRREVSLTYARIQDIQLASNVVERWLGIAKIQLQTASGSASAEMTIEGIREFDALRDFLYARTRGVSAARTDVRRPVAVGAGGEDIDELTLALNAVAAELRALRVERTSANGDGPVSHG